MAKSKLKEKFRSDPDTKEFSTGLVSAEWVLGQIDIAMENHTHNDKNSPQVDLKLPYDFAINGGDVYVKTPSGENNGKMASNVEFTQTQIRNHADKNPIDHPDGSVTTAKIADLNVTVGKLENNLDLQTKSVYVKTPDGTGAQSQFPDSGGELSNTYTRSVIDSKLNLKSDVGHNRSKSGITDFPGSMKNPKKLIINGQEYDGSNSLSVEVLNADSIAPYVQSLNSMIETGLNAKANLYHIHTTSNITDFPKVYTKAETDDLLANKSNTNHTHAKSNITDFSHTHPTSEITGLDGLNFITVPWGQALSVDGILLEGEDNKKHYRLHIHSGYLAVDNAMEDWPTSPAHHVLTVPFTNS